MPRTRAWRRHHRERVVANRAQLRPDANPGRFSKRKPFDCGNPRCLLCHYPKFDNRTGDRMSAEQEWRHDWERELARNEP